MNVVILGYGLMGSCLARRSSHAGHDVVVTGRDLGAARRVVAALGEWARVASPGCAARNADIILAATPSHAQLEALHTLGNLAGKTIVDVSNPPPVWTMPPGFERSSRAEEIAKALPEANVVKAFNTIFAHDLASRAGLPTFYAGDHPSAKSAVHFLIETLGLDPVDAGPLEHARYLEPMGTVVSFLADQQPIPRLRTGT